MSDFTHCSGCCINAGMNRARDRRERIATAALAGLAANEDYTPAQFESVAKDAVKMADALIAALDAPPADG